MSYIVYAVTGEIAEGDLEEKFYDANSMEDAELCQQYLEERGAIYTEILESLPVGQQSMLSSALLG